MTEATASARAAHEEKGTGPMEFSVKKFDLLEELQLTQGVVERKTTIPILSNLLFEAKGNRLTITATDLELSMRTSCEAKVKKEGAGTIPAKKLLELVRLLPEEEIRFKLLENHWVQVTSDRRNYKLVGMSKENFPALPQFPHALVKIPAKLLADLIAKTTFAISLEESRYTLNGALMVLKPGSVTMVATDGHRLAMVERDHKFEGFSAETRVVLRKFHLAVVACSFTIKLERNSTASKATYFP
jgi:DNA polymerase-3 subunit beta